jgi:hypothetical protein
MPVSICYVFSVQDISKRPRLAPALIPFTYLDLNLGLHGQDNFTRVFASLNQTERSCHLRNRIFDLSHMLHGSGGEELHHIPQKLGRQPRLGRKNVRKVNVGESDVIQQELHGH